MLKLKAISTKFPTEKTIHIFKRPLTSPPADNSSLFIGILLRYMFTFIRYSMAKQFKVLTCNPDVHSSDQFSSQLGFLPFMISVYSTELKGALRGTVIGYTLYIFYTNIKTSPNADRSFNESILM